MTSDQENPVANRIVFLSETDQDDVAASASAPGRPMFRKGQDSQGFIDALRDIVATVRGG